MPVLGSRRGQRKGICVCVWYKWNYSHALFGHASGDVEVEENLSHGNSASKQVEESREKHPAGILDDVVKVDYKAVRWLSVP